MILMPSKLFLLYIPSLIFFLRFLMEYTRCDYYNPLCIFIARITSPFLKLLDIPMLQPKGAYFRNINIPALLYTLLFALIVTFALPSMLTNGHFIYTLQAVTVFLIVSVLLLVWAICDLMFILLLLGAICSWIPHRSCLIVQTLCMTLVRPITYIFDKYIPPLGVISLSFFFASLLLYFIGGYMIPRLIMRVMWMLAG